MLLIQPECKLGTTSPPLGLAYIAAVLEKGGKKVEIIDCQITRGYKQKILKLLKEHSQAAISANTTSISNAVKIAKLIRENSPATRIIMGGPLPSAIYDKLVPGYADIVVIGEGEDTISELVNSTDLSSVKGIAYRENNNLKANPPRPLINDLDRIDFPAWHLFSNYAKYSFRKFPRALTALMITSRGCPYQCIYCTKLIHGSKMRLRSVDNVMDEITYLVERFKIGEIHIYDDCFTFYPEWVKEICAKIISKKYKNLRFALPNGTRADKGDKEMFQLMAKAGFYWVGFGIESASQEIQNKIKHNLDLHKAQEIIKLAQEAGIYIHLQFMLGLPFDTIATMQQTIDFAKSLPIDEVDFSITAPFPGTELYKMIQREGRFLEDLTLHSVYYLAGDAYYEIDGLKAKEVERMYRRAHCEFYFRPRQIKELLKRMMRINVRQLPQLWRERKAILFKG